MEGPPALPQSCLQPGKSGLIVFVFNMRSGIADLTELTSFRAGNGERNPRIPSTELGYAAFRTVARELL